MYNSCCHLLLPTAIVPWSSLANEQLQHFFNQHVFELELEEYTREGIDTVHISYVDNKCGASAWIMHW